MKIPNGFIEIVDLVLKQDPTSKKAKSIDKIWQKFVGCTIIGSARTNGKSIH